METTIDRSALFDAAARGDLDMIRCYFNQPAVQTQITEMNQTHRDAYTSAVGGNGQSFVGWRTDNAWFSQPCPNNRHSTTVLFDEPAERGHIHIFKWFFGEEAYGIIGDTMRSLLVLICKRELGIYEHCMEFAETILTSHLYLTMSPLEREFALSKMLTVAIESKKPSVVRLLVIHGASLMDPARKLGCCAVDGDGPTAQMLLDCGVFAVAHHALDLTAVRSTTLDIAEVFLKNGMDAQAVADDSEPLANAAVQGRSACVELFIVKGFADINALDNSGRTPLMRALWWPHPHSQGRSDDRDIFQVVSTLLKHGALVNQRSNRNETILHYAARNNYVALLPVLLEHGADPNALDRDLDTPLHHLFRSTRISDRCAGLDALLSHGADPYIRRGPGADSPFDTLMRSEQGREYVQDHPEYFANRHESV